MLAVMIEAASLFGAKGGSAALQSTCRRFGVRWLDLFGSAADT